MFVKYNPMMYTPLTPSCPPLFYILIFTVEISKFKTIGDGYVIAATLTLTLSKKWWQQFGEDAKVFFKSNLTNCIVTSNWAQSILKWNSFSSKIAISFKREITSIKFVLTYRKSINSTTCMKGTSVSQVYVGNAAHIWTYWLLYVFALKHLNPIFSKFQIRKVFHLFSTNKKQEYDRHR